MALPAYFYILLVTFRFQNLSILFYSIDTLISILVNESNDNIIAKEFRNFLRCNMEFRVKAIQQDSLITQ